MATTEEVEAKWAEYKAALADRVAKQQQKNEDAATADAANEKRAASYAAYVEAVTLEHRLEDEHEALSVAHEPPDADSQAT